MSFFFHRFSSVCSCATNIIIIISRKTKKFRNVIGDSVSISMCKLYLTSLICIFSGKNSGFDPSSNDTMADLANSTPSYIIQVCKQFPSPKKIKSLFNALQISHLTCLRRLVGRFWLDQSTLLWCQIWFYNLDSRTINKTIFFPLKSFFRSWLMSFRVKFILQTFPRIT